MSWFVFFVFIITLFCPEPSIHLLRKECWGHVGHEQVRRKKPATCSSSPQIGRTETQPGSFSTLSNAVDSWLLSLPFQTTVWFSLLMFTPGTVEGREDGQRAQSFWATSGHWIHWILGVAVLPYASHASVSFSVYKMHDSPRRCQEIQRLCVPVIKGEELKLKRLP